MRQPLQVSVFLFRMTPSGPEYAIFCRADDGCWQAVAGGVEDGEDLASAARRESAEEAGVSGRLFQLDIVSGVPRSCFEAGRNWPKDLYIVTKHHFALDVGGEGAQVVLSASTASSVGQASTTRIRRCATTTTRPPCGNLTSAFVQETYPDPGFDSHRRCQVGGVDAAASEAGHAAGWKNSFCGPQDRAAARR